MKSSRAGGTSCAPPDAEVVQTHVSTLLFLGSRVYKFKRPVKTGFIDLTTVERRRDVCEREVRLNRRLAPDVYLGVGALEEPGHREPVVVMKRLPADRRLSRLLDDPAAEACVRETIEAVARLHASAPMSESMAANATCAAVRERWKANFEELRFYTAIVPEPVLDAIEALAYRFLDGREALFEHRIDAARIRDGHGDLLADDVFCLADGPRILDCLEFDDGLRWIDVAEDCASLAMDLERLGRRDLAGEVFSLYAEVTGDSAPATLRHHYIAYRALVRCKIACMRAAEGDRAAAGEARRLVSLARTHLEEGAVRLVLVGGAPGTGKTTLAGALAAARDWIYLGSDEVRNEVVPRQAPAGFADGRYDQGWTDAVYDELIRRARHLLQLGHSVVLDATWRNRKHRAAAGAAAAATSSEVKQIRCRLSAGAAAARIAVRPKGPSEATTEIATAIARGFDPWPEATEVDTSTTERQTLDRALAATAA